MSSPNTKVHYFSVSVFVLLCVNAVLNIRSLPLFAHIGVQALFFYGFATLLFLIPSSLVCAELSARVGAEGGVYQWVRSGLGGRLGFLAIWLEWINNVIGFPATLSTITATLLYLIYPQPDAHRWIFWAVMMFVFWGMTFLNFFGVKASSFLSTFGAIFGTLLPAAIVILFGGIWVFRDQPIQFLVHPMPFIPAMDFSSLALWVGVIGALSGMQIVGFHFRNMKDPAVQFPKIMILSVLLIVVLSLGSIFSMSSVVRPDQLNLLSGVIQMYEVFFDSVGWHHSLGIFVGLLSLGMISSVSTWMLGPARGLRVAAEKTHYLPSFFAYENRFQSPVVILFFQSIIASGISLFFLIVPSFKEVFWMLVALMGQFTVLMYLLIFTSLLAIRIKTKIRSPAFQIPGGKFGLALVLSGGFFACVAAFFVGIFPPKQLGFTHPMDFIVRMLWVDGFILILPFFVSRIIRK